MRNKPTYIPNTRTNIELLTDMWYLDVVSGNNAFDIVFKVLREEEDILIFISTSKKLFWFCSPDDTIHLYGIPGKCSEKINVKLQDKILNDLHNYKNTLTDHYLKSY